MACSQRGPIVVPDVQKENDMQHRYRQLLTVFLCTILVGNAACSTTVQRFRPSQSVLSHYGIEEGDTVLLRYLDDVGGTNRVSSSSEEIKVTSIDQNGISGTGEDGEAVAANYEDLYQIEADKSGANKTVARAALMVACIALAANAVACPP
jgi:hypothetical protein